jgi:NADH-quinone oxidoreductase subunit F
MREVLVGLGSCGLAAGGLKVYQRFAELVGSGGNDTILKKTGCIGMCYAEVLVEVKNDAHGSTLYGNVSPEKVERIVESHIKNGLVVPEWTVDASGPNSKRNALF